MKELEPKDLYRRCDPDLLDFGTTRELEELKETLGQPRAAAAVEFAVGMDREGYNVFAFGPPGAGKRTAIQRFLAKQAASRPVPPDICYVNNFDDAQKPGLLKLPAGKGRELQRDMKRLIEELTSVLGAAFESEEYQTRRQVIEESFEERQGKAISEVGEAAREQSIALLRTPMGIVFAPLRDQEVLSPEEFKKLPEEERTRLTEQIEQFQGELQKIFRQLPAWQREKRDKVQELNREVSRLAVEPLIAELYDRYRELEDVVAYLEAVEKDVLDNAQAFVARSGEGDQAQEALQQILGAQGIDKPVARRYGVNVLVDHGDAAGAPVVFETNPTFTNLIGRVEHISHMGALVTDFNLIKPGALLRANGGFLLLDARKLLTQPYAWEGLKRALESAEIKIESLGQAMSVISTYSLEPQPISLELKVVLLGEPLVYYLLSAYDPDFRRLFRVAADFAEQVDRAPANELTYARLIARLVAAGDLRPFGRDAVARVLEQGAREAEDSEKLSLNIERLADLLREADFWATKEGRETVAAADVERAVDQRIYRSDRLRERVQEAILRGTVLIDTEGARAGRVNGLSVLQLGDFAFGRPSRITARVAIGKGEVVNIEREVELSGPLHSKGVLILAGFLSARYARERPLALKASVVFEQSYGGVDGDSASSTELYALLSALSELPIRQSLAVTGSINQQGEIQAIGGANEKIEGFFDICRARGLTGEQGVLIPASNVKHLMLRRDVVEAVAAGKFHIYAVETVDQGIELLTGVPAGERDASGRFPEGSVNARVEERLAQFARRARDFAGGGKAGESGDGGPPPDAAGGGEDGV